jgi:hypothetical protein
MSNINQFEFLDEPAASLSDMVFGFLEDGDWSSGSSGSEGCHENEMLELEDEGEENNGNVEEDKSFWENQHQLLHVNITILHSIINYYVFFPVALCSTLSNFCCVLWCPGYLVQDQLLGVKD